MKLLLDTHAFIWWLADNPKLSRLAHAAIADPGNEIFVSAATAWELATKARRGRLPEATQIVARFHELLTEQQFEPLAITPKHALLAGGMIGDHDDPFDRMIAAQAIAEGMAVVTIDAAIATLGAAVKR